MSEPDQEGGGRVETVVALAICAVAMLGPIVYIQHGYESFMGDDKIIAGAAGATLALAVVMRTVSRTVLRTIVRSSARAGLKASMKGALQAGTRVAARGLFASMFKGAFGEKLAGTGPKPTEPAEIRKANIKSLVFASGLLYASWIIVIGLGNPFGGLLGLDDAKTMGEQTSVYAREALENPERRLPEWDAFDMQVAITAKRRVYTDARRVTKGARSDGEKVAALIEETAISAELGEMNTAMIALLQKSNGKMREKPRPEAELEPGDFEDVLDWLYTYAPFPGGELENRLVPPAALAEDATPEETEAAAALTPVYEWVIKAGATSWASPILWAGGLLFVLPLWFIYGVQLRSARRRKLILRHETGIDGGMIQLYFAGAFSFMPLTSDVIVEGDASEKGHISVLGLLAPVALSVALWAAWKFTGASNPWILLAADAFLIYPMVQVFPLSPLDGVHVWRWGKARWCGVFFVVMSAFMFVGSEGLKNVI